MRKRHFAQFLLELIQLGHKVQIRSIRHPDQSKHNVQVTIVRPVVDFHQYEKAEHPLHCKGAVESIEIFSCDSNSNAEIYLFIAYCWDIELDMPIIDTPLDKDEPEEVDKVEFEVPPLDPS